MSEITTDMSRCNHNVALSSCITYHRMHNRQNTTGATSGARTLSGNRISPPFLLLVLVRFLLFIVFKCNVFTPLAPCCDVHFHFHLKRQSSWSLLPFVLFVFFFNFRFLFCFYIVFFVFFCLVFVILTV